MKRILLIDDSTTTQKLISITLANEPYEITSVLDGKEALSQIHKNAPDIALIDVSMPGMNGYELCREIKSRPSTANIRVILLFGVFDEINKPQVDSVGADATLVKPFETKSLLEVLDGVQMTASKKIAPELASLAPPIPKSSLPPLPSKNPIAPPKTSEPSFNFDEFWSGSGLEKEESSFKDMGSNNWAEIKIGSDSPFDHKTSLHVEEPQDIFEEKTSRDFSSTNVEDIIHHPEFKKMIKEMSAQLIEKIAWEVIPETAKSVIKQEINNLLKD